jgi:hypothetical protein
MNVASPAGGPFAPGSQAGPYRILRELGRGGMGRVLLAQDTSTGGRLVALKVLIADTTHRPLLEARFQREIKNLAKLRHPGIVTVFTAGAVQGHPYLAMDYLVGRELNEFAVECAALPGPERIERLGRTMAEVARAVAYAHSKGVVHRDIKPSNIRIAAETDAAVLLDFGISKCLDDIGLTGIEMPGTALYMAPEQFDARLLVGEPLIDVWALGVNLYFALTGRPPFHGEDHFALSHAVTHLEPEPPRSIDGDISPELEELILGCLRKDPHARIPSADAVAGGLEAALGTDAPPRELGRGALRPEPVAGRLGEPPTTSPGGRRAARARTRAAAFLLLGIVLASAALAGWIRTEGAAGDDALLAGRVDPTLEPTAPPAEFTDREQRIRGLLADDHEVVRSVLLYTSEIDVQHRRGLMAALTDLQAGRFEDALPKLQGFVREHPRSSLVPLVRFWIGTCFFEVGRLQDAIGEYDDLARTAPRSAFAPRAMLFEAASLFALGDTSKGQMLVRRLGEEYPDTEPAREAARIFPSGDGPKDRDRASRAKT